MVEQNQRSKCTRSWGRAAASATAPCWTAAVLRHTKAQYRSFPLLPRQRHFFPRFTRVDPINSSTSECSSAVPSFTIRYLSGFCALVAVRYNPKSSQQPRSGQRPPYRKQRVNRIPCSSQIRLEILIAHQCNRNNTHTHKANPQSLSQYIVSPGRRL
jgi:hypothetical protein